MADPLAVLAQLPWPRISLVAAGGLVGWAGFAWASMDARQPDLGAVQVDESVTAKIWRLRVPDIEPFEHYYGTLEESWSSLNPFIPTDLRERDISIEREIREIEKRGPRTPPRVDVVENPNPIPDPVDPPQLTFPERSQKVFELPTVYGGLVAPGGVDWLLVDINGESQSISNGDVVNGLQFAGILRRQAIFLDDDGLRHRVTLRDPAVETEPISTGGGSSGSLVGDIDLEKLGLTKDKLPADLHHIDLQRATKDQAYQRQLMQDPAVQKYIRQNPALIRQLLSGK
jgi:hypothetical protein